jgi:hypothetical protein
MKYLLLPLLFLSSICIADEVLTVDQLINEANKYDGKYVTVSGLMHLEFEGNKLQGRTQRVWLDVSIVQTTDKETYLKNKAQTEKYIQLYQDKEVILKGQFSSKDKGHFDMYSGSINNISEINAK